MGQPSVRPLAGRGAPAASRLVRAVRRARGSSQRAERSLEGKGGWAERGSLVMRRKARPCELRVLAIVMPADMTRLPSNSREARAYVNETVVCALRCRVAEFSRIHAA